MKSVKRHALIACCMQERFVSEQLKAFIPIAFSEALDVDSYHARIATMVTGEREDDSEKTSVDLISYVRRNIDFVIPTRSCEFESDDIVEFLRSEDIDVVTLLGINVDSCVIRNACFLAGHGFDVYIDASKTVIYGQQSFQRVLFDAESVACSTHVITSYKEITS